MKNNEEHDLSTQVALLAQKVGDVVEQIAKLERKLDSIMDKYETKFATKEELQNVKDDVEVLQKRSDNYIYYVLSTAVGLAITLIITLIK